MKKISVVLFASGVEALGYQVLQQNRDEAVRRFALAAGEIGKRGDTPDGANAVVVEGGLQFVWDDGLPEPPKEE